METLTSVGFTQALQERPISSLSGGWRMKLAIGALPPPLSPGTYDDYCNRKYNKAKEKNN